MQFMTAASCWSKTMPASPRWSPTISARRAFASASPPPAARPASPRQREAFDAVILDLMLPDTDGLDLCRSIRAESDIPLLMLTARGDPLDRVVGLELGADDYLPKPFEPRELLARLRAILRRAARAGPADVLRFGRLEIDRGARAGARRRPRRR